MTPLPVARPTRMLAGVESSAIKRLERKFRRLRLFVFGCIYEVIRASVCPALLCNPRRNRVAPKHYSEYGL